MKICIKDTLNLVVLSFLFLLTACGPKSTQVENYNILTDVSGLELRQDSAPTLVYVRPGAPDFNAYDRFIIDPIQVSYTDPEMKELAPEDVGKMQQYFRDAITKELRDAGYEIGTRSQAKTMRISMTISGLKAPSGATNVAAMAAGTAVGLPMVFSINVGEVTVEAVFREALTNRIDAVVVDRSKGSRTFNNKPWSTWADVEGAFDVWAEGIREAVDKAKGR